MGDIQWLTYAFVRAFAKKYPLSQQESIIPWKTSNRLATTLMSQRQSAASQQVSTLFMVSRRYPGAHPVVQ